MTAVDLTPTARRDLEGIEAWVSRGDPERAARFLEDLLDILERLASRPLSGRPRHDIRPGLRSRVHGSYVIFYRPRTGGTTVIRVLHGRRDLASARFPP